MGLASIGMFVFTLSQTRFTNWIAGTFMAAALVIISALFGSSTLLIRPAAAQSSLNIESWTNYGALAEQGALCAGFASVMESQDILYPELGQLWSERRKFSGAVIRRASEMENGTPASGDAIDNLISQYRRWLIVNLSEASSTSSEGSSSLDMSVEQMRDMLALNCRSLFASADEIILKRFPNLAYLSHGSARPQTAASDTARQAQTDALTKDIKQLQNELALLQDKVVDLRKENSSLKGDKSALQEMLAATRQNAENEIAALETARKAEQSNLSTQLKDAKDALKAQKQAEQEQAKQEQAEEEQAAERAKASQRASIEMPAPAKPQPKAKPLKPAKNISEDERLFVAQLGSFGSDDAARNAADMLRTRSPNLLGRLELSIEPHNLSSGSQLYRVLTPAMAKIQVMQICDSLWAAKLACLVKRQN